MDKPTLNAPNTTPPADLNATQNRGPGGDPADRTVADAANASPPHEALNKKAVNDRNPSPQALLARDAGQRPAN